MQTSLSKVLAVAAISLMIFCSFLGVYAGNKNTRPLVVSAQTNGANLVVGYTNEVLNPLNEITEHDPQGYLMLSLMYDSLLQWDQNLVLRPDLAANWTVSPDGKTYTFNLRQNVNWSDGKPLTVQDVVYTLEANMNYSSSQSAFIAGLSEPDPSEPTGLTLNTSLISTPNNYTLIINLPQPDAPLFLNVVGLAIIPEHIFAGQNFSNAAFVNAQTVGSGPFLLSQYVVGDHITFAANPTYWGGKPKLDSLTFKVFQTQADAEIALKDGEINYVEGVLPQDVASLNSTSGLIVTTEPSWNIEYMGYNFNPVLANGQFNPISLKSVREAIAYTVNMTEVVEAGWQGYATQINQYVIPFFAINGHSVYNTSIPTPQVDLTEANVLLNQSGYLWTASGGNVSNGSPYRFILNTIISSGNQEELTALTAIQQMLSNVGINLIIKIEDSNTFFTDVFETPQPESWNLYGVTHVSESPDPDFMASFMLTPSGPGDSGDYNNSQEIQLAAAADATGNDTLRAQIYQEIGSITAADYAWMWISNPLELNAWTTNFHGFVLGPEGIYSGDEGALSPWSLENVTYSSAQTTTSTTSLSIGTTLPSTSQTSPATSVATTTTTVIVVSTSTSSSSNNLLYVAIAVVVIVVIIAGVALTMMRRRPAVKQNP